jgi:uncharacterized membrane protein YkvA (DUF1232 family)
MIESLRRFAHDMRRDVHAVYLAVRDPRVPWYAKLAAAFVAGYALSPIDLIPDFIPVLGLLDDLLIVPLGIALVVKMIPDEIMAEHRVGAEAATTPATRYAAMAVIVVWVLSAASAGYLVFR